MQLLEYFAWKNLNDKQMNKFLSQIGLFLIFIQIPFFILYQPKVNNQLKILLISIYIALWLLFLLNYPIDFSMNKAPNGHLAWNWLDTNIYIIIVWLSFILGLLFYQKEYLKFSLYFITIFAIYYTYYQSNTWGSLWCWISNVLALHLIIQVFFGSNVSNYLVFNNYCK
jgi:hypothetical protein